MLKQRYPSFAFAVTALCLTSCAPRPAASDDSRYLAEQIVPKLTGWASGSTSQFDLTANIISQNYDHICFVGEYTSLNIIERNLGFAIARHHSDFGNYVPELKWAVVVVKRGEAHAALGDGLKLNLDLIPGRLCAPAKRARLIRLVGKKIAIPTARLEKSDADKS